MADFVLFVLVVYIMSAGCGLAIGGPRGFKQVTDVWIRVLTGSMGRVLKRLGRGLKGLARKIRR